MAWTHRTLIVPTNQVELARSLCAALAGPAGEGMFTTPLSPTGFFPATHYISAGLIEDKFADLLPLTSVSYAEDDTPSIETRPGDIDLTVQLAADAELPITEAEVSALLAAVDVSDQAAEDALARLGLKIISTPEI